MFANVTQNNVNMSPIKTLISTEKIKLERIFKKYFK